MTQLIAVFENGLHPKAKMLYAILYAYADDNGVAVMSEDKVAQIMRISPARLRGYRSDINKSGHGTVSLAGGNLIFEAASDHPARESDHRVITDVPISVLGTAAGDHPAHESDHPVITGDTPADPSDHPARDIARGARDSDHPARAGGGIKGGGRLVGINSSPTLGEKKLPTNQPVSDPTENPDLEPWEAALSEGLLLAQGCENLTTVRQTAQKFPFRDIRCHALAWQRDTKTTGPGGLLYRINSGKFAVPVLSDSDRRSALFLAFPTPAEQAAQAEAERQAEEDNRRWAERQAQATADRRPLTTEATTPDTGHPTPETGSPAALEIWQMALNELALSMPAPTFETWVRDTDVLSVKDGTYTIGVPHAYARDWLGKRLLPQVKRILGRLCQRSVDVEFVVRPRPTGGSTE